MLRGHQIIELAVRTRLLAGASLACSLLSASAFAQVPAASEAAASDQASLVAAQSDTAAATQSKAGTGLGDIVVTAQRREESLQRAAVAVDVLSAADMTGAGVTKAADLQNLVPSLQISNNGGSNASLFLRGVGTYSNNSYSDPAIAFNYDGVYIGRPAGSSGVFYDLERVEVLKGPQGTLYGRNATGGAINVIPARPKIGETNGYVTASYGNYDAFLGQAAINLATSDHSALRVAGTVIERDGYLSDGTSDDKGYAFRGQFLVKPSPDLSIRLAADYYKQNGKGGGANFTDRILYDAGTQIYTIVPSGLGAQVGSFDPRSGAFLSGTFAGLSGTFLTPIPVRPYLDNSTIGVTAELNWTSPLGTLTIQPAYRRLKQNSISAVLGAAPLVTHETDKQFSVEARFASDATGPFTWLLGGYYYDETVNSDFRVEQQVLDSFQLYEQKTRSLAAFARLTYKLTDTFRLAAGGRYTRDHKAFDGTADVLQDICTYAGGLPCVGAPLLAFGNNATDVIQKTGLFGIAPGLYISPTPAAARTVYVRGQIPVDLARTDSKFTYRVGFEWDAGPKSLIYGTYETGFRSGGFAFSLARPTFAPEKIEAFTLGTKNRFFDNRLQVNFEAFYWKYRDQQVAHLGPDPAVGLVYFTENIGRSLNRGAELEIVYAPVRNTRVSADIQYLDAKYKEFVYTQPTLAGGAPTTPPLVGCPVTSPNVVSPTSSYTIDCSGKPAQQSPKWTLNLGAEQTVPLGALELVLEASARYQSRAVTGFEYVGNQIEPGYWISNAAITLQRADNGWSISGFINNIDNKRAGTFTFLNGLTQTITQVTTAPRTYGARASFKF